MNDDDLKARFDELRAAEARVAPRFAIRRARRTLRPRLLAVAVMLLTLSGILIAAIQVRSRTTTFTESDRLVVQSVSAWREPTGFLLRTPGERFLTTTPLIPNRRALPHSTGVIR